MNSSLIQELDLAARESIAIVMDLHNAWAKALISDESQETLCKITTAQEGIASGFLILQQLVADAKKAK